jgi:lipooligosaccharide transport system permease protein
MPTQPAVARAPDALRAWHVVQRNALVYRRVWRGSVFLSFLQPVLFLMAMGIGLGALVERGGAGAAPGLSYLAFVGTGLLPAACMQTATFESGWPTVDKMVWDRNYQAMVATPLSVADVVVGELAWMTLRLTLVAASFSIVLAAFGVFASWRAVLAVPAAVLTGLAFGAPILAYAATLTIGNELNAVIRFIVTPLFLFSGVFFPVDRLPHALQVIAQFTPLFHGVALVRGMTVQPETASRLILHGAWLAAFTAVGAAIAVRTFRRALER